jgi:hypothetical protein
MAKFKGNQTTVRVQYETIVADVYITMIASNLIVVKWIQKNSAMGILKSFCDINFVLTFIFIVGA